MSYQFPGSTAFIESAAGKFLNAEPKLVGGIGKIPAVERAAKILGQITGNTDPRDSIENAVKSLAVIEIAKRAIEDMIEHATIGMNLQPPMEIVKEKVIEVKKPEFKKAEAVKNIKPFS